MTEPGGQTVVVPGAKTGKSTVHVANGKSEVTIVQPTVYNWIELIYKAFGYTAPEAATEVTLLGMREATVGTSGAVDGGDLTRTTRATSRGKKVAGRKSRSLDSTTTFDDLVGQMWTKSDAEKTQSTRLYGATIDPGGDEAGTPGTPYLLEGHRYQVRPGSHNGKNALHIFSATYGKIMLLREATKAARIFATEPSAFTPPGTWNAKTSAWSRNPWEFCFEEANWSIHMHFYYGGEVVKDTSTGCTALKHTSGSETWLAFMKQCSGAANKNTMPYLVVSSRYIKTYKEWEKDAKAAQGKTLGPESVIRTEGIQRRKSNKRALPSIVTPDFCEKIEALIKDLSDTKQQIASIRELETNKQPRPAGNGKMDSLDRLAKHKAKMHSAMQARVDYMQARIADGKPLDPKITNEFYQNLENYKAGLSRSLDRLQLPAAFDTHAKKASS